MGAPAGQMPPVSQSTPQQLAAGLQQRMSTAGQMPMSMQRQPQGGYAGRSMPNQMPNQFTTMPRGIQVR
jgi:hypothetical protein